MARDHDVVLRWRPFLLRPDIPPEGAWLHDILPADYLAQAEARLRAALEPTGLPFVRRDRVPNTMLAHEAARFAQEHGLGDAFHQAILRAYFGEGGDIGDPAVLADLGAGVGLDRAQLARALADRRHRGEVAEDLAAAREIGIRAVPTFVFDGRLAISGAQPYQVFLQALEMLSAKGE
ncbi:MAG: DsbA family oxidoreductase [Candidatus Sericytochromatia bacterium]|nr:DsbA family oxidoreductase [Candidatus Tanganyikabacteria bacterium]